MGQSAISQHDEACQRSGVSKQELGWMSMPLGCASETSCSSATVSSCSEIRPRIVEHAVISSAAEIYEVAASRFGAHGDSHSTAYGGINPEHNYLLWDIAGFSPRATSPPPPEVSDACWKLDNWLLSDRGQIAIASQLKVGSARRRFQNQPTVALPKAQPEAVMPASPPLSPNGRVDTDMPNRPSAPSAPPRGLELVMPASPPSSPTGPISKGSSFCKMQIISYPKRQISKGSSLLTSELVGPRELPTTVGAVSESSAGEPNAPSSAALVPAADADLTLEPDTAVEKCSTLGMPLRAGSLDGAPSADDGENRNGGNISALIDIDRLRLSEMMDDTVSVTDIDHIGVGIRQQSSSQRPCVQIDDTAKPILMVAGGRNENNRRSKEVRFNLPPDRDHTVAEPDKKGVHWYLLPEPTATSVVRPPVRRHRRGESRPVLPKLRS